MTWINENVGTVQAIKNKRVVVRLPRGGTFTFKSDRDFKIGEAVCFTLDPVLKKVIEVMPKKEADEIAQIGQDPSTRGVLIEDYEGIDLEDDDSGFAEEDPSYLDEEEINESELDNLSNQGQRLEGNFDFECGEHRDEVIEPGDYYGDSVGMDEPDGDAS